MKGSVKVLTSLLLCGCLTACGSSSSGSASVKEVDLSAYPSDINEWTAEDLMNYYTEAGVFANEDWKFLQEHDPYNVGTPINEVACYMNDDDTVYIAIFTFDEELQEDGIEECLETIRTDHTLEIGGEAVFPIDHMTGNIAYCYSYTSDEDVYNAMDEAYNNLVEGLGITPEF